jgi:pantoate--beta-alanine ligase
LDLLSPFARPVAFGDARTVRIVETIEGIPSRLPEAPRVLVPTMGALHRGHLELVRVAREQAGHQGQVIVTIFINPLQFEPGSDLSRYPRPAVADEEACRAAGVDLLFRPREEEMYKGDRSVFVEEISLSETLCGRSRPGHFRGVCTVVAKLFVLFAPTIAVFGQKDFQQLAIVRRMTRDLNFPVAIVGVPIVREADGLAFSSRNQYLTPEERSAAPLLHAALVEAAEQAKAGEKSSAEIVRLVRQKIDRTKVARIDYVDLVDAETLQARSTVGPNSLLALAVFFGKTRLIDNLLLS